MKAHPNATEADFTKMMDQTAKARKHLSGQLWQRLAHVNAETMGTN